MTKVPLDPDWTEYHDSEVVDWKRVRSSIEHENELTNHRQTWLMASQGFLVGSFGWLFLSYMEHRGSESDYLYQWVLALHCFAGVFLSVHLRQGIQSARDQHTELEKWWKRRPKVDESLHPPICGTDPKLGLSLPYSGLTFVFILLWLALLIVVFEGVLRNYARSIVHIGSWAIGGFILVAIGYHLGRRRSAPGPDQ